MTEEPEAPGEAETSSEPEPEVAVAVAVAVEPPVTEEPTVAEDLGEPEDPERPEDADTSADAEPTSEPASTEESGPVVAADLVVQTALRLLPVPEHAAEFWSALNARLDGEPSRQAPVHAHEPALATGPSRRVVVEAPGTPPGPAVGPAAPRPRQSRPAEPDLAIRLLPPAMRRRSNVVLTVLAVAALVLVLLAAAALVRQSGGGSTPAPTVDVGSEVGSPHGSVVPSAART